MINRKDWKRLYSSMRRDGQREAVLCLAEPKSTEARKRADAAEKCLENLYCRDMIDRVQVDGKIGLIWNGCDADCVQYRREEIRDAFATVAGFMAWCDDWESDIEGTLGCSFVRPDQIDRSRNFSRDLALEAFEDGHSHVVYLNH